MEYHSQESIIWFPGVYEGREGEYAQKLSEVSLVELVVLVQKRADEDGEWAISNEMVGDNEDKMRRMMGFVKEGENIAQCVGHILKANLEGERTVDWVCRDLANASKVMVR